MGHYLQTSAFGFSRMSSSLSIIKKKKIYNLSLSKNSAFSSLPISSVWISAFDVGFSSAASQGFHKVSSQEQENQGSFLELGEQPMYP